MVKGKPDIKPDIKQKLNVLPPGPWIPTSRELLRSGAMQALSFHARKCLDRIEIEHMDHSGQENGRLKVTWGDFAKLGVQRRDIGPALCELVAVGLVAIELPGRRIVWGESKGTATQYRLTWLPVSDADNFWPATNQWKRFGTDLQRQKPLSKRPWPSVLASSPANPEGSGRLKHCG